jgi:Uma2 family endonuclease
MPYYWVVDSDARIIEVYVLSEGVLRITARIAGPGRGSLPPFPNLVIDAGLLWRDPS